MKKNRTELLLSEPNMYKAFIILALPLMGANILSSLHDIVDTYFIGQLPNSVDAQAGIAITWPLINIFMALSSGLSVAGVSIISQFFGSGQRDKSREYSALLLMLATGIGIAINVTLYFISPLVLTLQGAEGGVYDAALTYIRVRAFEMVFLFIFASFNASRHAVGDTLTPVILSTSSIIINIILTAYFVEGLKMGIFGAALATLIGHICIVPPALVIMFDRKNVIGLKRQDMKFNLEHMKQLFRVATPSACSQALSSLGFLVLQSVILSYGPSVSAAFSNGNKLSNLLLIPVSAMGSVLAAFIGQNIGAENKERARQSYIVSRNIAVVFSIVGSVILYPFSRQILGLLTNNADTLQKAQEYILWVLLTQPLMAMFQNFISSYNGSGNTKYSFIIASARLWLIRLPLILFFKTFTDLGYSAIWYAMVISNLIILIPAKLLFNKIDFEPKITKKTITAEA